MVNTQDHNETRVRVDAEPEHRGLPAAHDTEEARPHPAAPWAEFMRTVCAGCPLC
jgi:hypothetical protein